MKQDTPKHTEKSGKTGTKKRKNKNARKHTRVNTLGKAIIAFSQVAYGMTHTEEGTSRPFLYSLGVHEQRQANRIARLRQMIRRGFQPCWWPA